MLGSCLTIQQDYAAHIPQCRNMLSSPLPEEEEREKADAAAEQGVAETEGGIIRLSKAPNQKYWREHKARVLSRNFYPRYEDILHCATRQCRQGGSSELALPDGTLITLELDPFRRTRGRRKWTQMMDQLTHNIRVVDLMGEHKALSEDSSVLVMDEAVESWTDYISALTTTIKPATAGMILVFSQADLLLAHVGDAAFASTVRRIVNRFLVVLKQPNLASPSALLYSTSIVICNLASPSSPIWPNYWMFSDRPWTSLQQVALAMRAQVTDILTRLGADTPSELVQIMVEYLGVVDGSQDFFAGDTLHMFTHGVEGARLGPEIGRFLEAQWGTRAPLAP